MWFELFGGLLKGQKLWYIRGKCDNKEGDLNSAHPFCKVLGYKRGSDITEVKLHVNVNGLRSFSAPMHQGTYCWALEVDCMHDFGAIVARGLQYLSNDATGTLSYVTLLLALPSPWIFSSIQLYWKLFRSFSNCESRRLSFQVSEIGVEMQMLSEIQVKIIFYFKMITEALSIAFTKVSMLKFIYP